MSIFSAFLNLARIKENTTRWTWRRAALMAVLVAAYFIAGRLGFQLASVNSNVTAVWPSAGIAFAAVLVFGYDALFAVFAGALLVNLANTGGIPGSFAIACGNTLETFIAVYLIHKYANGREVFERPGDIFRFAVLGGLASSMVAAVIGVGALFLNGLAPAPGLGQLWFTWWMGDATGILIFAPLLVLLYQGGRYHWRVEDNTAAGVFLIFLLVVAGIIFDHLIPSPLGGYPLAFLIVPPLMWAAYRFGRRITTATTVLLSIIAITSAFEDVRQLSAAGLNFSLVYLQFFIGFVSVSSLMFAAAVYQQRKVERAMVENEKRFRSLVEHSSDGIALLDARGVIQYVSPAARSMLGFEPEELVGRRSQDLVFSGDRERFAHFAKDFARHRNLTATIELRFAKKEGGCRWLEFAMADFLDDPTVAAIVVNFRDITERKQVAAAKNNFISSISYRLCPPLAQAETYIAALRDHRKHFAPLEQKYLDELDLANRKMITLTSDIIRLTRIELGTIRVSPKVIDLRKMAEDALQGLMPRLQAKLAKVDFRHPPARTMVTADPNLLQLALQRLLAKVVALMPDRGRLRITLGRGESDVSLRIMCPEAKDLRKKLQISDAAEGDERKEDAAQEPELAFGFYMVQSLISLMGGHLHFEPTADGGEAVVVIFSRNGAAAEQFPQKNIKTANFGDNTA
ncbi:MAG: MASE1 domain-containing protein [Patescibacteria group bacterium]|nr:MASE1 domain-containing protein [Patescibacteria group bacterium]